MNKFSAQIEIIGINPFVFVPQKILLSLFKQADKSKGHIPIRGKLNGIAYTQTLVKYSGEWRLYINTTMLKNSPKRIGEVVEISVEYDPESREIKPHDDFKKALNKNISAKKMFESLSPSRRNEIVRYLANLKSEEALQRNIVKAINHLTGKERFTGREPL